MPGRRKDLRPTTGVGVPGAGAHNPNETLTKPHNPNWRMSLLERPGDKRSASVEVVPEAGRYHTDASMNLTKHHSASWK